MQQTEWWLAGSCHFSLSRWSRIHPHDMTPLRLSLPASRWSPQSRTHTETRIANLAGPSIMQIRQGELQRGDRSAAQGGAVTVPCHTQRYMRHVLRTHKNMGERNITHVGDTYDTCERHIRTSSHEDDQHTIRIEGDFGIKVLARKHFDKSPVTVVQRVDHLCL